MGDLKKTYDGSEMDEVESSILKMSSLFILMTIMGFLYAYLWVVLLMP
ncbi:hypothetical protein [Virgibacillus sediminis]|uniref:Cytochrome c oxidase subunit 2A n=1 Tax=Virgibacillus sediminis TaxID=202260 RepID=A0ABV7A5R4_9BACI